MELLRTNGFDGLADAVTVLLNTAMVAERSEHLGAGLYERSASRCGYANGYKDKALKTRLGTLSLKVPQTRDGEFYPQSLTRGLRSERALLLAIAEMYVQGVSTRRVKTYCRGALRHGSELERKSLEPLQELDEHARGVAQHERSQAVTATWSLDAQYEKVRQGGQVLDAASADCLWSWRQTGTETCWALLGVAIGSRGALADLSVAA